MSQPRRRRRNRRRRPGGANRQNKREAVEQSRSGGEEEGTQEQSSRSRRSGRGRRGRTRARDARTASPKSSEDLVRGDPKRPPAQLTRPHDGTTLEQVIGELQSSWGVPQHPQEYRITLKVAEERGEKAPQVTEERADPPAVDSPTSDGGKPRREKAPAAPRIGGSAADAEGQTASKTSKRRRSRKRRKRSKGSGGS